MGCWRGGKWSSDFGVRSVECGISTSFTKRQESCAGSFKIDLHVGPEGPHPGHYHANVVDLAILTTAR